VIAGGILGALWGLFGLVPAMPAVGGGHSHNDMFIAWEVVLCGAILGALLGPKVLGAMLRAFQRRRVEERRGLAEPASPSRLSPWIRCRGMGVWGVHYVGENWEFMCGNYVVAEKISPDGRRKVVVFQRDCGATTGFSTQVSLFATIERAAVSARARETLPRAPAAPR
jgi:hypothetical protein